MRFADVGSSSGFVNDKNIRDLSTLSFTEFVQTFDKNGGRVVIQLAMGRSGSMFLQSLFDGHPTVLMFPGIVNFYSEFSNKITSDISNWKTQLSETLTRWAVAMKPYNIHNHLGINGNDSLNIDFDQIMEIMDSALTNHRLSTHSLYLAFHYAIGVYFKVDLHRINTIYAHEHQIFFPESAITKALLDFPDCKFLCITKDPRSNFLSIQNWVSRLNEHDINEWELIKYQPQSFLQTMCFDTYTHYMNLMEKYHLHFFIVRLEDVQKYQDQFVKNLAKLLEINFDNSLLASTFGGYLWGGDSFSTRKSGFRNSASPSLWRNRLPVKKQLIMETLLRNEIAALGYDYYYSRWHFFKVITWLYFPFICLNEFGNFFNKGYYHLKAKKGLKLYQIIYYDLITWLIRVKKLFKHTFTHKLFYIHVVSKVFKS